MTAEKRRSGLRGAAGAVWNALRGALVRRDGAAAKLSAEIETPAQTAKRRAAETRRARAGDGGPSGARPAPALSAAAPSPTPKPVETAARPATPPAPKPTPSRQQATADLANGFDAVAAPSSVAAPQPPIRADNPFLTALVASADRAAAALRRPSESIAVAPPVSRVTRVEGIRIHAVERPGARNDIAIVLIHGAGLDHRDWTFDLFHRTPTSVRVIAFDRPGFGASTRPAIAGGLPSTQARLLRTAAKAMDVERVILVGHSWGGAVAMAWGLDAPDDVIGVVSLAGAVAPWSFASSLAHNRRLRAAARQAMRPGGLRQAAIQALTESFAPDEAPERYFEHIATELRAMSGPAAAAAGDVANVNGALGLQIQRYPGFSRPVELLYGGQDAILSVDEQGRAAERVLVNARLTVMPEAGHMIHHTHPAECLAAIDRVLAEAGPSDKPSTAPSPKPSATRRPSVRASARRRGDLGTGS